MEDDNLVKKRELDENIKTNNKKICSRNDDITNGPSTSASSQADPSTSESSQTDTSTGGSSQAGPSTSALNKAGPSTSSINQGAGTSSSDQGGTTFADEFYLGGTFCDFKYRENDSDDSDDDGDNNNFVVNDLSEEDVICHNVKASVIGSGYYYDEEFDSLVRLVNQGVNESHDFLAHHMSHAGDDDDDELWEPMLNFDEPSKEDTSDPLTADKIWKKDPMMDPKCNLVDEIIDNESKI